MNKSTLTESNSNLLLQSKLNGVQIGSRLHSKQIEARQHSGLSKDEADFRRAANEMTFKPKILPAKSASSAKAKANPNRKKVSGAVARTSVVQLVPKKKDIETENMKVR